MRKSSCVTRWVLPHTSWFWVRTVPLATSCSTAFWGRGCCRWAWRLERRVRESRASSVRGGSCVSPTGDRPGSAWRCPVSTSWCISWPLTEAAGRRFHGRTWRSTRSVRTRLTGWQSWKSLCTTPCFR